MMECKYTPKISVIVAVYNVEQYIEKCAISLFKQTLDNIEYIFIDDCSTDRSIEVLLSVIEQFPHRAENIKIIHNPQNFQVAYTRTVGMKAATGTYVIHCDPDDFIDLDYYETIYFAAVNTGADIVATNYYRESNGNITEIRGNYYSDSPKECIKNIYRNYFQPFLFSHLVKRSLYVDNNIYPFKNVNTGEDLNVLLRIFDIANKIHHIDRAFYHYILRSSSLTQSRDYWGLWSSNISKNLKGIIEYFEMKTGEDYSIMLNYFKFTKKQILLSTTPPSTELWYKTYSECRKDILKFTTIPMSRRLLYILFSYSFPLLNLYFKVRY